MISTTKKSQTAMERDLFQSLEELNQRINNLINKLNASAARLRNMHACTCGVPYQKAEVMYGDDDYGLGWKCPGCGMEMPL